MAMKYNLTKPCAKCPFRNDIPAFITADRVRDIDRQLERNQFPCHETMDYENADGDTDAEETDRTAHCAGALILLEKIERPSQMMRIMERIGGYDARKLDMSAPVYEDFDEMESACEAVSKPRKRKQTTEAK